MQESGQDGPVVGAWVREALVASRMLRKKGARRRYSASVGARRTGERDVSAFGEARRFGDACSEDAGGLECADAGPLGRDRPITEPLACLKQSVSAVEETFRSLWCRVTFRCSR